MRSTWDEVNQMIAAANVYTIKQHGPDRIIGFSPIPAMSMIVRRGQPLPEPDRRRVDELYDWYCDLPPSSPQTWGEQTDVPEAPTGTTPPSSSPGAPTCRRRARRTRTSSPRCATGRKVVSITPDYSEVAKLADLWMHPSRAPTRPVAMAMGHVILKEFYFDKRSAYFRRLRRRYTDLPLLVVLKENSCPTAAA